ncbi:MAG: hypothetical protein Q4B58_09260, partial [Bacteroidales bacterium]|nr:hypothetical protein [Bacteroidales bacterium]
QKFVEIIVDVIKKNNNALTRSEVVDLIVNMRIDGFGKSKIQETIKNHLALPNPSFFEANKKLVVMEQDVQHAISFSE